MVNLSEVKGNSRENRTAAHTHIKGLGLRNDGTAETSGSGFVGQMAAREVSSMYCLPRSMFKLTFHRLAAWLWTSYAQKRCLDEQYC